MLARSGKRVDDVIVVVRGNWEFSEGEELLDPVPRLKGEPGCRIVLFLHSIIYAYSAFIPCTYHFVCASNDLKKTLTSVDDAVLEQVKTMLKFFGRPNL